LNGSVLAASVGYAVALGALGISIKLALRSVSWPVLIIPTLVCYAVLIAYFLLVGGVRTPKSSGSWILWVVVAGLLTAGSFPLMNFALERAPASQVIPITAAYPVITLALAALFLGESVTGIRLVGVVLVVAGAILVSR
jgi:transporter family protein